MPSFEQLFTVAADDEDAAYIYLDLADVKPPVNIREGDTVQLKVAPEPLLDDSSTPPPLLHPPTNTP